MKKLEKTEKEVKDLQESLEKKRWELESLKEKNKILRVINKAENLLKTLKPVFDPLVKDWEKYHKLECDYTREENYESFMDMCRINCVYDQEIVVTNYVSKLTYFGRNIAHYILLKEELKKLKKEVK